MPPLAPAVAIPPAAVAPIANPPIVDAPPVNNNNVGGQPLNAAINAPTVEIRFEDVENYMVKKDKKESLELVQDLKSKQMPEDVQNGRADERTGYGLLIRF